MPKLQKATLVMSDHHLGNGQGKLEDFPRESEKAYIEMLEAHLRIIGPDTEYEHVIAGDWLDYHAVEFEGSYGIVPTEEAALAKTRAILDAHAELFAGFRRLTRQYRKLVFRVVPGNHDLDIVWPSVQELVRGALVSQEEASRVAFDREAEIHDSVLCCHGDQFDPFSANPSAGKTFKEVVVVSRLVMGLMLLLPFLLASASAGMLYARVPYTFAGIAVGSLLSFTVFFLAFRRIADRLASRYGRKRKILNVPVASYMNAGLGTKLKKWFFPGIGRRADHGDEWILGVAQKWYILPLLLPTIALEVLSLQLRHYCRRLGEKLGLRVLVDLIVSTTRPDHIEKKLRQLLAERPNVRHLIAGHTHDGKMETFVVGDRTVTYYNTGTAVLQVHTHKPEIVVGKAWPNLETFFRRVLYCWTHAPLRAVASTVAYAALPVALFLLPPLPYLTAARWPLAASSLFFLLSWQFSSEYRNGTFLRFTPVEVLEYETGAVEVRILRYEQETRRFLLLTGEEAAWRHRPLSMHS